MAEKSRDFLVSTADVAFYHNDILAFTGTTSTDASISVTMEEQEITGGKGNKSLYKFKHSRKMNVSITEAEWNLAYIAAQIGSNVFTGLEDVFAIGECVTLSATGIGTLALTPVGKVSVEKADGTIMEVTPTLSTVGTNTVATITVPNTEGTVKASYQYNTDVKRIVVDADSTPWVGKLLLSVDKHNNLKGKVGEVQVEVPSFQLSGNFDISLTPDGSASTSIEGDALAVAGASCTDGDVYAYITEIASEAVTVTVNDISATPGTITLKEGQEATISVVGLKGVSYSNVAIANSECTFTSNKTGVAKVGATTGVIQAVAASADPAYITVKYGDLEDVVIVKVVAAA